MNTNEQVLTMQREHEEPTTIHNRVGCCPTCGNHTEFVFLGVQHWPARLVELTGCPAETILFTCKACNTTVSENDIQT
jgi:hypothetical protein